MPTLADMRQRFYNRFDEGQQNYIGVAEANSLLNEGAAFLHNWIINSAEFYLWSEWTVPLVRNQMDYTLPADFYKSLKVFATGQTGFPSSFTAIDRIMPEEFQGSGFGVSGLLGNYATGYMIMGNKLRIIPAPTTSGTGITMWYAPVYTYLVNDTDSFNLSVAPGWDEFIVNHAVIAARIKEESDTGTLERRQAQITAMIEASMVNRDMGRHQHVVDIDDGF